MTICIIASSDMVPSDEVLSKVIAAFAFLPERSVVRIRSTMTSRLEYWVSHIVEKKTQLWELEQFPYIKGSYSGAYPSVLARDMAMVRGCDLVIAFFSEDRFMEGGTGNVVNLALSDKIPVEAWVLRKDKNASLVASFDTDDDGEVRFRKGETWEYGRKIAEMVLSFAWHTLPYSMASPRRQKRSTNTGSRSTGRTGVAKSPSGSIFQVRSD